MNHNLDDLIIDEPELDTPKPKSVLSKIGLIIIVLIVGIVISKLIISDKGDPVETVKDKELSGITDPSNTDPEITKKLAQADKPKRTSNSFDQDLAPINQGKNTQSEPIDDISIDDSDFGSDYGNLNVDTDSQNQDNQIGDEDNFVQKDDTPPAPVQRPKPTQVHKPKPKPKPHPKPKPKPKPQTVATGRYFIQIGSFSKKPSSSYLSKIKQKGYTPYIIPSGNLYKVRVGPYNSFQEASSKLSEVKSALSTDGFVVKRK